MDDEPINVPELAHMSCTDFSEFKEAIRTLRLIDDKIIYNLNTSVPTDSFKQEINAEERCQSLYKTLLKVHHTRDTAIKGCILTISDDIKDLKKQRDENPDDVDNTRKLRKNETALRLMRTELNVEEVVKIRSMKVFAEKCWKAYKPPKET